jgi:hypothetical protein
MLAQMPSATPLGANLANSFPDTTPKEMIPALLALTAAACETKASRSPELER